MCKCLVLVVKLPKPIFCYNCYIRVSRNSLGGMTHPSHPTVQTTSTVQITLALSGSLWPSLSLAHSDSVWLILFLSLALSGAHQLTRSLLGSPHHGHVATVYPGLVTLFISVSDGSVFAKNAGFRIFLGQPSEFPLIQVK